MSTARLMGSALIYHQACDLRQVAGRHSQSPDCSTAGPAACGWGGSSSSRPSRRSGPIPDGPLTRALVGLFGGVVSGVAARQNAVAVFSCHPLPAVEVHGLPDGDRLQLRGRGGGQVYGAQRRFDDGRVFDLVFGEEPVEPFFEPRTERRSPWGGWRRQRRLWPGGRRRSRVLRHRR